MNEIQLQTNERLYSLFDVSEKRNCIDKYINLFKEIKKKSILNVHIFR